jgi:hypothetical protein
VFVLTVLFKTILLFTHTAGMQQLKIATLPPYSFRGFFLKTAESLKISCIKLKVIHPDVL